MELEEMMMVEGRAISKLKQSMNPNAVKLIASTRPVCDTEHAVPGSSCLS
jgi:hypothetical protein